MQILFSQKHRAGSLQAANNFSVFGGDAVFESETGGGSANASSVDQVFQGERNTMQRSAPVAAPNLGFGLAGLRQGGFRRDRNERIQLRIELFDACQARGRQFDRRD